MIKKALRLFLISIALFIYSASSLASGTSGGLLTINPDLNLINEVLFTKDSICLHTWEGALYRWQSGQSDFEPYAENIPTVPEDFPRPIDADTMGTEEKSRFSHLILRMFSDGEQLYGLNQLMGTWAKIGQDGKTAWQDSHLDTSLLHSQDHAWVSTLFAHGGTLYGLTEREQTDLFTHTIFNLVMIDLDTGESRVVDDEPIICAAPYREGEVLLLLKSPEDTLPGLAVWHEASQSVTKLPLIFLEASAYNGLAYDQERDAIYVAAPGTLLRSAQGKDFAVVGSIPFDFLVGGTPGHILAEGYYALHVSDIALVPIGNDMASSLGAALRLRGSTMMDDGLNAYRTAKPGSIIQHDQRPITPDQAWAAIHGGDQETDIYLMPLTPALYSMLQKGYAADVSMSPALNDEFNSLYPSVKAALTDAGGTPRAYPIAITAYSPSLYMPLWRKYMGREMPPATYPGFLDAMQRFISIDDAAQPEAYFVADLDAYALLCQIIISYIQRYEPAEEALEFDRPELSQALERLEKIARQQKSSGFSPQQILGTDIADEDIKPELFFMQSNSGLTQGFGIEKNGGFNLLPFTFAEDETAQLEGYLQVLLISPHSVHLSEAMDFAQMMANQSTDPVTYALLHPEANEPVPNPDADQMIAADEEELRLYAQAIDRAKETGAGRAEIERLESVRDMLQRNVDDSEYRRWLLSAEQLSNYRSIADQILFYEKSRLLTDAAMEQFDRICRRYADGQLTLELFLAELESTARLIYWEAQ